MFCSSSTLSFALPDMDIVKLKWKRSLIVKTWERCLSLSTSAWKRPSKCNSLSKSKSRNCSRTDSSLPGKHNKQNNNKTMTRQVAPEGCFSVYVGSLKQRFFIKTELANHPLFKLLLEDAKLEYGYSSQGPILLPCDVDLFYKVLAEMESGGDEIDPVGRCRYAKGYNPFILCSPARRSSNKSHGAYRLLSPSRMLKFNGF